MKSSKYLFTSESVTEGHPDKVCDQISDAILDSIMKEDPSGRVACETMVTTGLTVVAGEITTSSYVDIPRIVRQTIKDIGYTNANYGFDYLTSGVITSIQEQSPDIAMGVDVGGAGDQGMMFGYATDETKELMPMPITLAHELTRQLSKIRKEKLVDYLRPDGKSQVTVEYHDGKPKRIEAIVVSAHHDEKTKMSKIHRDMKELVIKRVVPAKLMDKNTKIFINPTGRFEVGGPHGDTGVTGRKIIVDTYGGVGSHGGGAFSGKDPSKVDRSASYMARYVAKNIVASGIAGKCEIQFAYAIGVAEPVSVMVNTFGTGKISEEEIVKIVRKTFDLTPGGIIEKLKLRRPIYLKTAAYGHFGRKEQGFTWEETDMAGAVKKAAK
ncbi:MAG: methionine adenosyltransferase [Candidatus Omnitrophica bacterium]|nr:methionine adenosyltransferase [Candidatus Omnitrophota bacterium]MDD5487553.1 methionine adenosyltransferase [Candidatus Omnitrophota bacterium]